MKEERERERERERCVCVCVWGGGGGGYLRSDTRHNLAHSAVDVFISTAQEFPHSVLTPCAKIGLTFRV